VARLRDIFGLIRVSSRPLYFTGWLMVAMLAPTVAAIFLDSRELLGVNVWLKPAKFMASIAIFCWTLALLLAPLAMPRLRAVVSWGVSLAMLGEIVCIAGQSLRGVTSHFNRTTPFDGAVFNVMGLLIMINTALTALVLAGYFTRHVRLPAPVLWGVRLGLVVFLAGSAVGGLLVRHGAHTIGAPDGGPGLPVVNWSTEYGDLRVSHAVGLHGLQLLPLFGLFLDRWTWFSPRTQTVLVFVAAAVLMLAFTATLMQAWLGVPLVPLG
jgi:hypothetical protein